MTNRTAAVKPCPFYAYGQSVLPSVQPKRTLSKRAAEACCQSVQPECAAKLCGRGVRWLSVPPKRAAKVCFRSVLPRCAAEGAA
eukprot:1654345-Pleurochrysis_carterae.AAC.1